MEEPDCDGDKLADGCAHSVGGIEVGEGVAVASSSTPKWPTCLLPPSPSVRYEPPVKLEGGTEELS